MESQMEWKAYHGRGKMLGLTLLSLIFVLVGAIFVYTYYIDEDVSMLLGIIGIICILFFGLCGLYFIKRLLHPKPAIILRKDHFVDQSSYIAAGTIAWTDVTEIFIYEYMGQHFIGVNVKNPDQILERMNRFQVNLVKANQKMVRASVNISKTGLTVPLEQLYEEMVIRWETANHSPLHRSEL